jgi:hypothetical protein
MYTPDYEPRLSIRITREQQQKLQQYLPRGWQVKIFRALIEDLIKILESPSRNDFLIAIFDHDISLCEMTVERSQKDALRESSTAISGDDRG